MSGGRDDDKRAMGDYPAELRRRLVGLRREHPEVEIDVSLAHAGETMTVVRAAIRVPGGGMVSALGAVTSSLTGEAIGQAEARAIERALALLEEPERESEEPFVSPAAAPAPAPAPTAIPTRSPQPVERRPPAPIRTNAPVDISSGRASTPPPPSRPSLATEAEPAAADYSWTAFWNWAREQGFSKQKDIEDLIGQSYEGLTPADVRKLISAKRGV